MNESCEAGDEKPKTFSVLIRSSRFWKSTTAVLIGGVLGYIYYYFEGCTSGSCGIASDPISSIIFGGAIGFFFVNKPCQTC